MSLYDGCAHAGVPAQRALQPADHVAATAARAGPGLSTPMLGRTLSVTLTRTPRASSTVSTSARTSRTAQFMTVFLAVPAKGVSNSVNADSAPPIS